MLTAFALCGGLAVLFAAAALIQKTLYGSAMCLLGVLLEVAALFVLVGADLLGFIQVLVYAGAVMVLIVIAILSAPPGVAQRWTASAFPKPAAWLLTLALFAGLCSAGRLGGLQAALPHAGAQLQREMARLLFGPWALAVEAVGLLVLIASLAVIREDA
ncbi:MAG: NADH-quinone oxidoreductase subunit J [Elusimicrobia bacterium]|nr:NADH-quinone oxidoreductase subunit J [Elusimicrobiota bacterium]